MDAIEILGFYRDSNIFCPCHLCRISNVRVYRVKAVVYTHRGLLAILVAVEQYGPINEYEKYKYILKKLIVFLLRSIIKIKRNDIITWLGGVAIGVIFCPYQCPVVGLTQNGTFSGQILRGSKWKNEHLASCVM